MLIRNSFFPLHSLPFLFLIHRCGVCVSTFSFFLKTLKCCSFISEFVRFISMYIFSFIFYLRVYNLRSIFFSFSSACIYIYIYIYFQEKNKIRSHWDYKFISIMLRALILINNSKKDLTGLLQIKHGDK